MKKNFLSVLLLFLAVLMLNIQCKKKDDPDATTCTWTTVFFDDFNRADGPVGSNYSVQFYPDGKALIQSEKLILSGQFWAVRYINGINDSKIRLSILFYTSDSSAFHFGVTGKSRDLGNNWMNQEFIMGATSMSEILIEKCTAIQPFNLGTKPFKVEANKTYRLSLVIDAGIYTVTIEDLGTGSSESLTVTDTSPLSGNIVSINGFGSQGFFDDFKVEVCN